jgi:Tol biopolymer transport system component
MDVDGGNKRMVTDEAGANFAPFFHPSGERIIFSSNRHDPSGRNFDLYMIDVDGTGLERITVHAEFDGFPMFSPDGTKLVFSSNRGGSAEGETNVFIADWVDDPGSAQSH